MRNTVFVNQLPEIIAPAQLDAEIKQLSNQIVTKYVPEVVWISGEEVSISPKRVICYNIPDNMEDITIKEIINLHIAIIFEG